MVRACARAADRATFVAVEGGHAVAHQRHRAHREALINDLDTIGDTLADDSFGQELYRALAGGHLTKEGGSLALSWSRAEAVVNSLRERHGGGPLILAQTGGEGELGDRAGRELERLGWAWRRRDTERHDDAHRGQPASPPPAETGERQAPVSDSGEWERTAHEEADAARRGDRGAPPEALPGTGAGGGEPPRVGGS